MQGHKLVLGHNPTGPDMNLLPWAASALTGPPTSQGASSSPSTVQAAARLRLWAGPHCPTRSDAAAARLRLWAGVAVTALRSMHPCSSPNGPCSNTGRNNCSSIPRKPPVTGLKPCRPSQFGCNNMPMHAASKSEGSINFQKWRCCK